MTTPDGLQTYIETVNRVLGTERVLPDKLEAVAEILERTVQGCDSVSIALVIEGRAATAAASSQLAVEADLVQYHHHEGPCLTALARASTVRIDVLGEDERFEHFAPGAIEIGVLSSVSIPLAYRGVTVGSIDVYSTQPQAFDETTVAFIGPYAEYAAELIGHSPLYAYSLELMSQVSTGVETDDTIATAVGILKTSMGLDDAAARAELGALALERHHTLLQAARRVITGQPLEEPDTDG